MCLASSWFLFIPKTIDMQIYFLSSFGGPEKIVICSDRFVVTRDSVWLNFVYLAHSFCFFLILSCHCFNWVIICRKTEKYSYLITEKDQYFIWNSQLMTVFISLSFQCFNVLPGNIPRIYLTYALYPWGWILSGFGK